MRPWLSRKRIFEIVMSGKSPRSVARTSPIDWWSALILDPSPGPCAEPTGAVPPATSLVAHVEGQVEPPDLDLVTVVERADIDPLPVHVGAVEGPGVAHHEATPLPDDLAVPTRDGDVVEEHGGLGMPSDARDVARHHVVAPGVRTPRHVQHRPAAGDVRDDRQLDGGVAGRRQVERGTTRRAVARRCLVQVPAGATHHRPRIGLWTSGRGRDSGARQSARKASYAAASISASSSDGSESSIRKIHPAPYGSVLRASGVASRSSFTATTVPLTGQ